MVSPGGRKRMRPSLDSPTKPLTLDWIPDGMDRSSTCRIAVRVADYVEICDDGTQLFHRAKNFQLIVDRDTTNLKDISDDIALQAKHGSHQGMTLTFWNKSISAYSILTSDSQLMDALDIYWDIRHLPLTVTIYDTVSVAYSQQQITQSSQDHLADAFVPENANVLADASVDGDEIATQHGTDGSASQHGLSMPKSKKAKTAKKSKDLKDDEEPWADDEEEYVGLNDEAPYMSDVEADIASDDEAPHMSDIDPEFEHESSDSDLNQEDQLVVDDSIGCETVEHVTNLENPSIAVGVTFEDGATFKRAIRQYAVLNEFEIAAPYSERERYRGYCKGTQRKGKNCKWRIHASQLQDGMTWQIKKLQPKHTCASTSKLKPSLWACLVYELTLL
ncbi:unnamed protein product [Urochloa humidicola]